jgi:amino acid transporter
MELITTTTTRPRNVDWKRSAAILYGDWGTSKAYVMGLAFAVAGYSSPWLIGAMCLLTALVAYNYIIICRHHPNGGGVYATVRHRSEIISIVGAFLLVADYVVTAAVSALSAFLYLGVPHPEYFAAGAILLIGCLNYFGPKHTGGLAVLVSIPTAIVVVLLGIFAIPHLGEAVANTRPLQGGFAHNWAAFVGIVLALSGVESIANATSVMKLNPGSTLEKPNVSKTATKALVVVMIEVCFFTAFLGLAMAALPGMTVVNGDVNAPGAEGVRDYMLRYMGQIFAGNVFGPAVGNIAGWAISGVFAFLLLSAVNTSMMALSSISFLMARDKELPPIFAKLNPFGVPNAGLIFSMLIPAGLVLIVSDMAGLAELYAVGVVGAMATNLGTNSTDSRIPMKITERSVMFVTFVIMAAIEISLLVDKPNARIFAFTVLAIGLILRGLAKESAERKAKAARDSALEAAVLGVEQAAKERVTKGSSATTTPSPAPTITGASVGTGTAAAPTPVPKAYQGPILTAVRGLGRTLDFAVKEAAENGQPLYVLFVREQPVIAPGDRRRKWTEDKGATEVFDHHVVGDLDLVDHHRTVAEVDGAAGQSLVHRQDEETVAADAGLVAERFLDGLTEHDAHVFHGVVVVDVGVAGRLDLEVHERVAGEERQHVVEEGHAGGDFRRAGTVQVHLEGDLGLGGIPAEAGFADGCAHPPEIPAEGGIVNLTLPSRPPRPAGRRPSPAPCPRRSAGTSR